MIKNSFPDPNLGDSQYLKEKYGKKKNKPNKSKKKTKKNSR